MAKTLSKSSTPKQSRAKKNPEKWEYAYLLYMKQNQQKDICDKVGISAPTLISWIKDGGWEEKRGSQTISVDSLIQKTLKKANEMLDGDSFNADAFAKAVSQLKQLKTGSTVNDEIHAFIAFGDWLIQQRNTDKTIDDALIKKLTSLQDIYILHRLSNDR